MVEIGIGKSGRRAYGFDDIAIVPSRRTRDPEDVSLAWEIDAYRFELPLMASPMDGVDAARTRRSPSAGSARSASSTSRASGPGTTTRSRSSTRSPPCRPSAAVDRMREIYAEPIEADLITARVKQIRDSGVTVAASLTPQRTVQFAQTVIDAGVDLFVIQGTVVSAEHVSATQRAAEPQALHRRARRARDRRRLRDVPVARCT